MAKKTSITNQSLNDAKPLLAELRHLIVNARNEASNAVNTTLVTLYWHVGRQIQQNLLQKKRAEYGAEIISALGLELEAEFGRGWSAKTLRHMVRFAEAFPEFEIVSAVMRQFTWTHFLSIIYLEDPLKREFYVEMSRLENWSTRTLQQKISTMLFERTALSKKPEQLIASELKLLRATNQPSPDFVFKDPYILDFLGLHDTYSEKDFESAILREVESFILELGIGFAFCERQKRMQIDNRDYYLDLLFYHRKLKRLIAIDLKLGDFDAADKGQMELYLGWLKRYAVEPDENPPLGMILCAGKSDEHIELLELAKSGIHVASYWTKLAPKAELQKKLHDAVRKARSSAQYNNSLDSEKPSREKKTNPKSNS